MTTTITAGQIAISLPDGVQRSDEFGYSPIRQSVSYTITGALWIDVSVEQAGEPITLSGGRESNRVWGVITRAEYQSLRELADQPGLVCTLTYRGIAYSVVWRHDDAPALTADDLIPYADPGPDNLVIPTLKFRRIA